MPKPSMKTNLSMMLGKIEATRGTDPLPTAVADSFLVGDLDIQLDPAPLERNVFRRSFSPVPNAVGRKVVNVTFSHEIKSSGDVGVTRPKLGTLLRACGMRELLVTAGAANQIETPAKFGVINGPVVTWGKTAAPTAAFGSYLVEVITGGPSATATLQVTRWAKGEADNTVLPNTRREARVNHTAGATLTLGGTPAAPTFTVGGAPAEGDTLYAIVGGLTFAYTVTALTAADEDACATALAALIDADTRLTAAAVGPLITVGFAGGAAAVVVTTGVTGVALGNSGATITPSWAGNLVAGQKWVVSLYETGYMYRPTSNSLLVETITLYVFKDGQLHIVTACMGTVTFEGEAGQIGQANFEFTGNYLDPVEEPTPLDAVFEETVPPQIELAQLSIKGDSDFCAQSFNYTLGNETNIRECMNAQEGYDGSLITGRTPTAQFNPEATYEAYTGMWRDFSRNDQFAVHTRVGSLAGNIVRFYGERGNFTGLTYGDRNNAVTMDVNIQLNGLSAAGDDELRVAFN